MSSKDVLVEKIKSVCLTRPTESSIEEVIRKGLVAEFVDVLARLILLHKLPKAIAFEKTDKPEDIRQMQNDIKIFHVGTLQGFADVMFYLGIISEEQSEEILKIILGELMMSTINNPSVASKGVIQCPYTGVFEKDGWDMDYCIHCKGCGVYKKCLCSSSNES